MAVKIGLMKLEDWAHIAEIFMGVATFVTLAIQYKKVMVFCKRFWKVILPAFLIVALYALWVRGYFDWLFHPVTLPIWEWILFGGILLAVPIVLWAFVHSITINAQQPETLPPQRPDPHNYVNDHIFGVMWLWSYDMRGMINLNSLTPICPEPNCLNRLDRQMDFERYTNIRPSQFGPPISLSCSHCHFKREFDHGWEHLQDALGKEIERRINTGEYIQRTAIK